MERLPMESLSQKQAAKCFWGFAALWFGIWVVLPCLMCTAPSNFDVIEQLILGREWVLGSAHHPPFAFWCIESVYQLCGHIVASSAVCGALTSFVGLWAIWRLSRYYVSETKALLIVFACAAYRYLNMGNVNFTTSIPPTVIWCLAIFFLFRAVEWNWLRDWLACGFVLGCGMICKYSLGLLVLTMVLYLFWERKCRRFWLTPGPWLTTAAAFLVFSPHLYWLIQNDFPPIQFAAGVLSSSSSWNHLLTPLRFLGCQICLIFPVIIPLIPLCGCIWQLRRDRTNVLHSAAGASEDPEDSAFRRRFLTFMLWFPVLLQIGIFAYTGSEMVRSQYGSPLWTLFALWYVLFFRNFPGTLPIRRGFQLAAAVLLVTTVCYWADFQFRYAFTSRPGHAEFPTRVLGAQLEKIWSEKYGSTPCPMLTGQWKIAGHAALGMKDRPSVLCYYDGLEEGRRPLIIGTSDEDFAKSGGIVVWKLEDQMDAGLGVLPDEIPEFLTRRFPTAEVSPEVLEIPWCTAAKIPPLRVRYAIAPPPAENAQSGGPAE